MRILENDVLKFLIKIDKDGIEDFKYNIKSIFVQVLVDEMSMNLYKAVELVGLYIKMKEDYFIFKALYE